MTHHERPRFLPASTYRLQVHGGFPLTAARDVVPYVARLGIGAVYTSPYFAASPGSTHGYDVCNHNEISKEAGGAEAHSAFVAAVAAHGLMHIVDFVPNHMGIGTGTNAWWNDVLENGPSSPSARFFDIDWSPVKEELHAKLLLPILGDQYGRSSAVSCSCCSVTAVWCCVISRPSCRSTRGRRRVSTAGGRPAQGAQGRRRSTPDRVPQHHHVAGESPPYTVSEPEKMAVRQREKEVARTRLTRLTAESPDTPRAIDEAVRRFNGEPGKTDSFDQLHELLELQAYRLAHWRTASHEINYRRFFDINTLAGLRVEDPEVFAATHRLLASLIADEKVHAVRIDHPDGLFDPARYFSGLQDLAARAWNMPRDGDRDGRPDRPLFIVAERILSGREMLPRRWAVHGTTGYNFLNDLNGIYIDAGQVKALRRAYAKLTGRTEPFDDVLYESKRLIIETAMASELTVLAHMLDRIAESSRRSRDFTRDSLRDVIVEVVACFPVYRTYVDEDGWTPEDRTVVERAIARAQRRNPAMESSLFDFFREVMLPREVETEPVPNDRRGGYPPTSQEGARDRLRFAMKLQQYTGPVQAKGLEDTTFYRYNVLLSVNEVGGDPLRFGRTVNEFHDANLKRLGEWPQEMLATATHDTKLGEDVRARVNAISELPVEWGREVSRWMRLNRNSRTSIEAEPAPDPNDEYRFYQALVGMWPLEIGADAVEAPPDVVARLQAYMLKAAREAKVHTSWLTPNQPYEDGLNVFVERVLTGTAGARFIPAMLPFQRKIALLGVLNSLSQLAMKLGSPGVPDFYQGTDLWDLSLVDPDNRRPVDFSHRETLLNEVDAALALSPSDRLPAIADVLQRWRDGRIKLLLTAAGLRLRRRDPALFLSGRYVPLECESAVAGGSVAFARIHDGRAVLFVGPRLCAPLVGTDERFPLGADAWKTSRVLLPEELAGRTFRHEITGAEVQPTVTAGRSWLFLAQVFEHVPVGILTTGSM